MSKVLDRVCQVVEARRDEAIGLLRELVAQDSSVINQGERGNEGNVQPLVAQRLRDLGCEVDVFEPDNARLVKYTVDFNKGRNYEGRPNVVGVLKGKGGGRSLILNGRGGNGTLACVDRGYRADAAIITEGTGERVIVANRGVLNVEVVVSGSAAHAGRKWTGVSAIEKAVKIIQGLSELERRWLATKSHPFLAAPTITVGQIEGGVGATVVPDSCTMKIDVKFLPQDVDEARSPNKVKREFEDWAGLIAAGDDWMREHPPTVRWYSEVMPYEISPTHPFVVAMKAAAEEVIGEVPVAGAPGGSDARLMQNIGKVPTILFGTRGQSGHSANENVEIESYLRVIKALANMIVEWAC
ncbi:MAG: M20/M25/M40 family metallo-hydrolase [Betaproteobacteria bacterium]